MIKYLKEYRFYIALFLFLLIPVIAIDTTTRAPRDHRLPDRVILAITAPIQKLITATMDAVTGLFQSYFFLLTAQEQNEKWVQTNRNLQSQLAELREAQQENIRLKKILHFQEQTQLKTLVAHVIARDVTTDFRSIRLNRGSEHGIRKNMAVLTPDGVVGRVLRVTPNTADVVTLMDFQSSVDAIVERSRARGVLGGLSEQLCELKYALRTDDIQVGDVLVTGGLGGIFPKGIPLGTVSRVNRKSYGITQEIEVRPSVQFSRLEEVMVVIEGDYNKYFVEAETSNPVSGSKRP